MKTGTLRCRQKLQGADPDRILRLLGSNKNQIALLEQSQCYK